MVCVSLNPLMVGPLTGLRSIEFIYIRVYVSIL